MRHASYLSALCDKVIEACWIAAIVLTPLFFNVYSSRVFEPDKLTLLRSIALTMIAAWAIKWIEQRRLSKDADQLDQVTRRTPLVLPTLILVVVYLISTIFSLVPNVSFFGSYQRLQGTYSTFSYIVVFAMLITNMRKREQLDRIITAIVMTSLPIAFYGLLQHGNGVDTLDPLPWGGDVTSRVAANMGNSIFVAAYLIMAFFLTMGRVVESFRAILTEEESRVSDVLRASAYIFVAAIQLITFGFADSRGPLLGWLPGMFIFGLVGFLMLRVSLHSQNTENKDSGAAVAQSMPDNPIATEADAPYAAPSADTEPRFPITVLDLIKALALSVAAIGIAAAAVFILVKSSEASDVKVKLTLIAVVGLLAGLLPVLVTVGIRRTAARWAWASLIVFALAGAVSLFLINFSDIPKIVELRQSGVFGQLATLFESEGGTGKVRTLIWEGSEKLVTPHAPIKYPDGQTDPMNFLRPLIGYGPESMYVAYNSFYPPDLAHHEARNASPDRSHNETWDSLVITGGFGFLAEQFLFISVFFFALKFIGWIPNRKAALTYIALMILGGVGGAIGLMALKGVKFFGPGWPGGVTAGIVVYILLFALFHFQISRRVYAVMSLILILVIEGAIWGVTYASAHQALALAGGAVGGSIVLGAIYFLGQWVFNETAGQPIDISSHVFIIMALFGGILAHYLEISLAGIAIAATRTYFWTFAGLLVTIGLHWVPTSDEPAEAIGAATSPTATVAAPAAVTPTGSNVPRHKKKSRRVIEQVRSVQTIKRNSSSVLPKWFAPVLTMAIIGALILMTLGYEFINNSPANSGPCAIKSAPQSPTELIVNSLTHLPYNQKPELCNSQGALLMFGVTWLFGGLLSLTELRRREILAAKDVWPAVLGYFGISIGLALAFWLMHAGQVMDLGRIVSNTQIKTLPDLNNRVNELLTLAGSVANLLSFFYFVVFTLIVGMAISMLMQGRTWFGKWATDFGGLGAVVIVPLLVFGIIGTNLNNIRADTIFKQADPLKSQGQWDAAIAHYKVVSALQPNEDFFYLWMGAAFLEKATNAPLLAADRPSIITPQTTFNSIMNLDFDKTYVLNQPDTLQVALTVLTHARDLNPLNTDHSANLARLYRRWSDLETDKQAKRDRLATSSAYYGQATILSPQNAQLWNEWATVNLSLHDIDQQLNNGQATDDLTQAQSLLDHSLSLDQQYDETYLFRGQLDRFLGKNDEALQEYQNALKWNPDSTDAWGGITDLYSAQGNYTGVETITLSFLQTHPTFVAGLRTLARNAYIPAGRLADAIDTQQQVIQLSGSDPNVWDDYRVLAIMLAQAGRLPEALQAVQTGLKDAPADKQAEMQALLTQIQQQSSLGAVSPNTGTVPSPLPAPGPNPAPVVTP